MRTNPFIRLVALLLIPAMLQQPVTAMSPENQAPSSTSRMTCDSVLSADFSSQALAPRALSPLHAKPFLSRVLRIRIRKSEALTAMSFVSIFIAAGIFAYHHWHNAIVYDPLAERKSYALLAGAGGLAGGLIAQWLKIRSGKQAAWEWRPLVLLIALNVGYSTFGEKPIYGDWLESIPSFWHIPGPLVQWVIDMFAISLIYTDPAAFLVYGTYLDPRREQHAREEIRDKFLGFYVKYGWVWGIFLGLALAFQKSPVLSFTFLQAGILIWNVAFDYEKFPTSQEVLEWAQSHRGYRRLVPIIRRVTQFHAHPFYFTALRWAVVTVWLIDTTHFLSQLGMPDNWVAYFAGLVLLIHFALIYPSALRRLFRFYTWSTPLMAAPLLGAVQNSSTRQENHVWGWLLMALTFVVSITVSSKGNSQRERQWMLEWVGTFMDRVRTTAFKWQKQKIMPNAELFAAVLHSIANETETVLSVSRLQGPDSERKWQRRMETLVFLGKLIEGWSEPIHAEEIHLLATVAGSRNTKKNKRGAKTYIRHWLLRMENDNDPVLMHIVTRADPAAPRVKISFWRDGPKTKRNAALEQDRFGWDQKPKEGLDRRDIPEAHVDMVRADKPSTLGANAVRHFPMPAWNGVTSPHQAIKVGLRWVQEVNRLNSQFPLLQNFKKSPAFQWISFPWHLLPSEHPMRGVLSAA